MVLLYTLCIFLSAFLVFLIQPIAGRIFLPAVGGSPAVWNNCMFFFQLLLLCGYYYAHAGFKKLNVKRQPVFHIALLLVTLFMLPGELPDNYSVSNTPTLWLLGQLFYFFALPFFVLSSSAPIIQKWFYHTNHKRASNPFFLYAASNIGSMLALLGYPFIVEPNLKLYDQLTLWRYGFYCLALTMTVCAFFIKDNQSFATEELKTDNLTGDNSKIFKWFTAAFLPSALMLAVTTHLTTVLAPVPLLWIAPLALYLLTFVIVFSEKFKLKVSEYARYAIILLILFLPTYFLSGGMSVLVAVGMHLFLFFLTSIACHGYLSEIKPPAEKLTDFYLWMSIGGVAGGFFTSIVAPSILVNINEYPLIIVATIAFLRLSVFESDQFNPKSLFENCVEKFLALIVLVFIFEHPTHIYVAKLLEQINVSLYEILSSQLSGHFSVLVSLLKIVVFTSIVFVLNNYGRLKKFNYLGFLSICLVTLVMIAAEHDSMLLYKARNFFGVKKVLHNDNDELIKILQGNTIHGMESTRPDWKGEPLAYYHRNGPLGDVFDMEFTKSSSFKAGIIGLGPGSMLAYARPGQEFRFYEIDPEVSEIAKNRDFFSFLQNDEVDYKIITGDGRIKISQAQDSSYDLIIIDAFSSGFVPVHLLSVEAFEVYKQKLKPEGVIAMNISSRYLNLFPVISATASQLDMYSAFVNDYMFDSDAPENYQRFVSDYAVISPVRHNLPHKGLKNNLNWFTISRPTGQAPWTDNFSSLFQALIYY